MWPADEDNSSGKLEVYDGDKKTRRLPFLRENFVQRGFTAQGAALSCPARRNVAEEATPNINAGQSRIHRQTQT